MYPILFEGQDLILYSYPLLMGLGWGVAYQVFMALLPSHFSRFYAQVLYWGIFISAWVGAKLLFLLTLPHEQSFDLTTSASFWTGGGFVFYGGLLAGILYVLLYRSLRFPYEARVLWAIIPALTFGHGIGRIGCLLAGCCYGKETDWWWGIFLHESWRHPTQILEAVSLLLLGWYLLKSKKEIRILSAHYLIMYGCLRIFIEALRGDGIRGMWGPLTPSQWISLVLILWGMLIQSNKFKRLHAFVSIIIK